MHYLSPTAPWHCKCTVELYECPDHQYISNDIGDEEHADALDDAAFYWVAALWTWVTSAVLSAVCITAAIICGVMYGKTAATCVRLPCMGTQVLHLHSHKDA